MTEAPNHDPSEMVTARTEARWRNFAIVVTVLMAVIAAVAGIGHQTMPQARVERVDPKTLHISGEFIEGNLGSALEPDGSVTVRVIAQQYSFVPQCMLLPTDTRITFRATSADVVHGFLVQGSNINTMLVPGYISVQTVRFSKPGDHLMPCHEFCGLGHEGMWAHVHVIEKSAFVKLALQRPRVACSDP
jgi:cytochrome c oxidase subunit II